MHRDRFTPRSHKQNEIVATEPGLSCEGAEIVIVHTEKSPTEISWLHAQ